MVLRRISCTFSFEGILASILGKVCRHLQWHHTPLCYFCHPRGRIQSRRLLSSAHQAFHNLFYGFITTIRLFFQSLITTNTWDSSMYLHRPTKNTLFNSGTFNQIFSFFQKMRFLSKRELLRCLHSASDYCVHSPFAPWGISFKRLTPSLTQSHGREINTFVRIFLKEHIFSRIVEKWRRNFASHRELLQEESVSDVYGAWNGVTSNFFYLFKFEFFLLVVTWSIRLLKYKKFELRIQHFVHQFCVQKNL